METSSETNNSYAFFRNELKTSRLTKQDKARKSFEKTIVEAKGGIVLRVSRGYFCEINWVYTKFPSNHGSSRSYSRPCVGLS
jgi:hypothetical protein